MFASATALLDRRRASDCRDLRPRWKGIFTPFSDALQAYHEGNWRRAFDGFNGCARDGKHLITNIYEARDVCDICWWVLISARCFLRSSGAQLEGPESAEIRSRFEELKSVLNTHVLSQCRDLPEPQDGESKVEASFRAFLEEAASSRHTPHHVETDPFYIRSNTWFSAKKLLFDLCSSHIKSELTKENLAELTVQGTTEQLASFLYSQGSFLSRRDPCETADLLVLSILLTRKPRNRAVVMRKLIPLFIFTGQLIPSRLARLVVKEEDRRHAAVVERKTGKILPTPGPSGIWPASVAMDEGAQAARAFAYSQLLVDLLLAVEKGDTEHYRKLLQYRSPMLYQERSLIFLSKGTLLCEEMRLYRVIRRLVGESGRPVDSMTTESTTRTRLPLSKVAECYDKLYPPEKGKPAMRDTPQTLLSTIMTLISFPCSVGAPGTTPPRFTDVLWARVTETDSPDAENVKILLPYGPYSFLNRRTPFFTICPKLLALAPRVRPCSAPHFVHVCTQVVSDYVQLLEEERVCAAGLVRKNTGELKTSYSAFETCMEEKLSAWKASVDRGDRDSVVERRSEVADARKALRYAKSKVEQLLATCEEASG